MSNDYQRIPEWFGIRPQDEIQVAWGGRAILSSHGIDIPHDRQQWRGFSAAAQKYVDACLKELDKRVKQFPPNGITRQERSFVCKGWTCRYNTRASCGYLYIGIWKE